MHIALTEDQTLLQDSLQRVFREHSTGARIRAAEPSGFDRALWGIVVEQGIPLLRTPEPWGSNASLMHAVVAAEESGRSLASAPVVETMVANRLLGLLGGDTTPLLEAVTDGKAIVTLALHDLNRRKVQVVPGAAEATHVLARAGKEVFLLAGCKALPYVNHGAIGCAKLDLASATSRTLLRAGDAARLFEALFEASVEEWRLLNAARVVAAGRRAVEMAAEYACEREAFGRKIGEYQGVSHALADAVTDLDGARLLVWRAVDKIAHGVKDASATLAMAVWWSGQAARPATLRAMRVFGGYGMTMEYDAQLYFRRANAWSLLADSAPQQLNAVADRLYGGRYGGVYDGSSTASAAGVNLPDAGAPAEVGIDFDWGADADAAADRMRAFAGKLDLPKMERFMRDSHDGFDRDLYKNLAKEGLLYPDYPVEMGGAGLSLRAACAVFEVQADMGWHMLAQGATDMIGKIIYHFASEEAKREILPKVVSGDVYCSLGYTEPSNGSDIFAVKTSAKPVSDEPGADWIINGQKMFTSAGHVGNYSLMITRTAPDKYKGITVFIVPLDQPGYEFTEIKTISEERTNVTFYRDLRVPDKYRIGPVNGGVKVMAAALTLEQTGGDGYLYGLRHAYRRALEWAARPNDNLDGARPLDDPDLRRQLAETAVRIEVGAALGRYCYWAFENGKTQKQDGPMSKLFCSEAYLWCSQWLLAAVGPEALEIGYDGAQIIEWMSRRCIPGTIYAGTSEIQRSIVAESALKLPRSRG